MLDWDLDPHGEHVDRELPDRTLKRIAADIGGNARILKHRANEMGLDPVVGLVDGGELLVLDLWRGRRLSGFERSTAVRTHLDGIEELGRPSVTKDMGAFSVRTVLHIGRAA
jgi:hypothetical protein